MTKRNLDQYEPSEDDLPEFVTDLSSCVIGFFHEFYERVEGGYRLLPDGVARAAKEVFDPDKFDPADPSTWNKQRWIDAPCFGPARED